MLLLLGTSRGTEQRFSGRSEASSESTDINAGGKISLKNLDQTDPPTKRSEKQRLVGRSSHSAKSVDYPLN